MSSTFNSRPDLNLSVVSERVRDLWDRQEFDEIVALYVEAEKQRLLSSLEMVIKGRAIVMGSGDNYTHLDAGAEFHRALDAQPDSLDALEELGYYYYALLDDAERAAPYFEKALKLCSETLTLLAQGHAGCLEETESEEAAATALRALHRAALQKEMLEDHERDWLDGGGTVNHRGLVVEVLALLASGSEQLQYEMTVPAANFPDELVCWFCDDVFHPTHEGFTSQFTDDEMKGLAHLYGVLCETSKLESSSVIELLKQEKWRTVMRVAQLWHAHFSKVV